jgi:hypothetical protein
MASSTRPVKGDGSMSLTGWLLVLLLLAVMARGGGTSFELSRPESKRATVSTPCLPEEDPNKPVRLFHAKRLGEVELRCRGWRHIQAGHPPVNSRTYACIRRVLASATPLRKGAEWLYRLEFRGGDHAEVRVNPRTKVINSAYTKGFKKADTARWRDCTTGRIR